MINELLAGGRTSEEIVGPGGLFGRSARGGLVERAMSPGLTDGWATPPAPARIATSTRRRSRAEGAGLERGVVPRGWRADVRYVPPHENRSHGSTMGIKLRRYRKGARFRYVFC